MQHVAQAEPVAQVQNLRGAIVAVGPQQDLGRGPMAADLPDQTPDVGGGLCDWVEAEAPNPVDLLVEGAANLKAAVIPVVLHYSTDDPLA